MCVILACEDKFPTSELLKSCEVTNPHGAGIAWNDSNGNQHYRKGIDSDEIISMIESGLVKLPCIVHFRIASVGTSDGLEGKKLCHPFPINDKVELDLQGHIASDKDGLLFHNGTVSNYEDIVKETVLSSGKRMLKGVISDSRIMAFSAAQYGHEFIPYLDSDTWNKYAILDKDGIHKYGNWHEDEGVQASNQYYKMNSNNGYIYGLSNDFDEWDESGIDNVGRKDAFDEFNDEDSFNTVKGEWIKQKNGSWKYIKSEFKETWTEEKQKDVKELNDFFGLSDKIKYPSKKKLKKERNANIQYLLNHNWVNPQRLDNKALYYWVHVLQTNKKTLTKDKIQKTLNQREKMNADDYVDLFKQNEEWIEKFKS